MAISNPTSLKESLESPKGFSLLWLLTAGFGVLMAVGITLAAYISIDTARHNTYDLLQEKASLFIGLIEERVTQLLRPAEFQTLYIKEQIEQDKIIPEDTQSFKRQLTASLAAAPQLHTAIYMSYKDFVLQAIREGEKIVSIYEVFSQGDNRFHPALQEMSFKKEAYWGEPVWSTLIQDTLINFRRPVFIDNELVGISGAAVKVGELSRFLNELGSTVATPFILYGDNRVLAHPFLQGGDTKRDRNRTQPLPTLDQLDDPVLKEIWNPKDEFIKKYPDNSSYYTHVVKADNREYVIIYTFLNQFSDTPLIIGSYSRIEAVDQPIIRIYHTILFGIIILIIAVLLTLWMGHIISRPIKRLAEAAQHVQQLEFNDVKPLSLSPFREINRAIIAYNAMLNGLKAFEAYVPKKLVRRLIQAQIGAQLKSEVREMTVLFTDLVGFTTFSEQHDIEKVTALLNHHFSDVLGCIEAEEGTVDKFIGDSVMAFWGAPERLPDHAIRACRAAMSIAEKMRALNKKLLEEEGQVFCRLRIGIQTGPAMVGNVGTTSRMNYTVIGDTVNSAERIQELGKTIFPKEEICILMGSATADTIKDLPEFHLKSAGTFDLRGKAKMVKVYRLIA